VNRKLVLGGAALVLVAAAAVLAVFAVDVLRWRGHLEEADMRYTAGTGALRMWEPGDTWLPDATRTLLGVEDDVELRRALQRFRLARVRQAPRSQQEVNLRSAVEADLARLGRGGGEPGQKSLAAVLRGALAFEEARQGGEQPTIFLRRSLTAFREAIRLDPSNEDAKYDVELVLRLLETVSGDTSGGTGAQRGNVTARGAGSGSSGTGF
jgi:hypothetical protein